MGPGPQELSGPSHAQQLHGEVHPARQSHKSLVCLVSHEPLL